LHCDAWKQLDAVLLDRSPMGQTKAGPAVDTNGLIAALLRDLAAAQESQQSRWGYKRAASAVRNLDAPIESYLQPDGTLRKIPNVGPASTRVIMEVLTTGKSETVERHVSASGKTAAVAKSRELRGHFLTRAQVLAALGDATLRGPRLDQYRGDLQMHSVWSDGSQTLDDIVATGIRRGYEYSAVTDHSYGLPIAGGVSMARLAEQHRDIDRLNAGHRRRFRLLKGIEANIRVDGSVDMLPDELRQLEIVVAAPHAALRSPADQTARLLRAVATPGIHILGHPRGRMYGSRPGVTADWPTVFAAAARAEVAIEIDGDPSRQDVDYDLAALAVRAGCLFALDSDAHGVDDFAFAETAVAHARLANVPADRVINCWPLDRLLAWASRHRP
jgi:histidinol phosphatase-like PHP family hydrolase